MRSTASIIIPSSCWVNRHHPGCPAPYRSCAVIPFAIVGSTLLPCNKPLPLFNGRLLIRCQRLRTLSAERVPTSCATASQAVPCFKTPCMMISSSSAVHLPRQTLAAHESSMGPMGFKGPSPAGSTRAKSPSVGALKQASGASELPPMLPGPPPREEGGPGGIELGSGESGDRGGIPGGTVRALTSIPVQLARRYISAEPEPDTDSTSRMGDSGRGQVSWYKRCSSICRSIWARSREIRRFSNRRR